MIDPGLVHQRHLTLRLLWHSMNIARSNIIGIAQQVAPIQPPPPPPPPTLMRRAKNAFSQLEPAAALVPADHV